MSVFLWGSATAAYQCEGAWNEDGKGQSNWDVFCHSEKNNINPATGDTASDHYHRFEEDLDLMAAGGQNAYRFSIAWTRIIPNGTGVVNPEGIAHYNAVIDACLARGIEPVVTLYHYDLPESLFVAGGWENRQTSDAFCAYAKVCFNAFGDRVRTWFTVNEPNYDTLCCYGIGNYPPNVKDLSRRWRAMYHMLLASAKAVTAFREGAYQGMIGLVSDSYAIEARSDTPDYQEAKRLADLFYNRSVNDVAVLGQLPTELIDKLRSEGQILDYLLPGDQEILAAGKVDMLGINAYDRMLVKPCTTSQTSLSTNNTGTADSSNETNIAGWFSVDEDPTTQKNAWGMELYPKSIYTLLHQLNDRYPNLVFMITENGMGYRDQLVDGQVHDTYRVDFLKGFVNWTLKAREEGCDVRGYFVWSTMDLYSWINGYAKRYGLVYVDYNDNCRRIPKDSYYWYKDTIAAWNQKEGR